MDILLPILPTINNTLIPSVGSSPAITSATSILPQLMNLPNASILHGIVSTPRNAHGHIVIATDKGELALKTDIFMRRGMDIMIRLDKSTDELMAKIISIDGKSVGKYIENLQYMALQEEQDSVGGKIPFLTEETPEDGTDIHQRTLATIKQHFDPQKPQILRAILMASAASPSPTAQNAISANTTPAPTTTPTHIPNTTTPAIQSPLITPTVNTPTAASGQNTTPINTPTPSQQPASPPPSGTQFSIHIVALQLPQQPTVIIDTTLPLSPELLKELPLPNAPAATSTSPTAPHEQTLPNRAAPPAPSLIFAPPLPSHANATAAYQHLQTSFSGYTPQPASMPAVAAIPNTIAPATPSTITTNIQPSQLVQDTTTPAQNIASITPQKVPHLPPNTLTAQVIHSTPEGDITLHTQMGTMRLFSPTPFPIGTTLLIETKEIKTPTPLLPTESPDTQPLTGLATLASLLTPPNSSIDQYQISPIPRDGKELVTDMLFFLSALKGGDISKWLGEKNTRTLQQKKYGDLLERISSDFQSIKPATVADTPASATNWQHYTIPLLMDGNLATIQLLHRRHHYEQENSQSNEEPIKNQSDHFVVGITLTHLGELQLDGFVKTPLHTSATKINFELIIRSQQPLPDDIQKDIHTIFLNAQTLTGCTGTLQFRHGQGACLHLASAKTPTTPPNDTSSIIA